MRLFKVGDTYHCWFYFGGRRVKRTTHCTDRRAADVVGRRLEQEAADPACAAAARTSLDEALGEVIRLRREQAKAGLRSQDTVEFYLKKAAVLTANLGSHLQIAALQPPAGAPILDAYVSDRRRSVADPTIYKELVVLRAALKLQKRKGAWTGDLEAVFPEVSGHSKAVKRFVQPDQFDKLLRQLDPDDAARAALMVAAGAELRATERALDADINLLARLPQALLRGTKRASRERSVPLMAAWQRQLAEYALRHARGQGGQLFNSDTNGFRFRLRYAAKRCGLELSANDLRRTYSTWLLAAGAPTSVVAPTMGHSSTRMLERVYDARELEHFAATLSKAMGLDAGWTDASGSAGTDETVQQPKLLKEVPGTGIEPVTRGFSVSGKNWGPPSSNTSAKGRRWTPAGQRKAAGK